MWISGIFVPCCSSALLCLIKAYSKGNQTTSGKLITHMRSLAQPRPGVHRSNAKSIKNRSCLHSCPSSAFLQICVSGQTHMWVYVFHVYGIMLIAVAVVATGWVSDWVLRSFGLRQGGCQSVWVRLFKFTKESFPLRRHHLFQKSGKIVHRSFFFFCSAAAVMEHDVCCKSLLHKPIGQWRYRCCWN